MASTQPGDPRPRAKVNAKKRRRRMQRRQQAVRRILNAYTKANPGRAAMRVTRNHRMIFASNHDYRRMSAADFCRSVIRLIRTIDERH